MSEEDFKKFMRGWGFYDDEIQSMIEQVTYGTLTLGEREEMLLRHAVSSLGLRREDVLAWVGNRHDFTSKSVS